MNVDTVALYDLYDQYVSEISTITCSTYWAQPLHALHIAGARNGAMVVVVEFAGVLKEPQWNLLRSRTR